MNSLEKIERKNTTNWKNSSETKEHVLRLKDNIDH